MALLGDCDAGVVRICELCGWSKELEAVKRTPPTLTDEDRLGERRSRKSKQYSSYVSH